MLAIRPDLVDLDRALNDGPAQFRPYDRFPKPPVEVPPSGVLSMTEGSTAEKGEWLLADSVGRMIDIINEEFK
jgi:creatinine amidohydrolase